MRFAYYEGLSAKEKRAYDASDKRRSVPLADARALAGELAEIEHALTAGDRARTEAATRALIDALVVQTGAPPVVVQVLASRPRDSSGELHGFYQMFDADEDGPERCELKVWMRTAAQKKPVAFRSFVRTVLHELVHHLDFARDRLDDSFHTHGFFARESDLARQLIGESPKKTRAPAAPPAPVSAPLQSAAVPKFLSARLRQPSLFDEP